MILPDFLPADMLDLCQDISLITGFQDEGLFGPHPG